MIGYENLCIECISNSGMSDENFKIDIHYELTLSSLQRYLYLHAKDCSYQYELKSITFDKKSKFIVATFDKSDTDFHYIQLSI